MPFLSPMFAVAGALLVAIPVVIHLLNRRRYKVVDWAAMQFLLAAMRKNRRRLQFEQWLLLAMRCAVIGLLGLALARPVGCGNSSLARLAGTTSTLHVIVIDNAYPMAYEADRPDAKTNLDQAKRIAHQMVEKLANGGDSIVLITAAKPATAVIAKPTYDITAALSAIDRIEQSYAGADLAGALQLADQIAGDEAASQSKTLDLLTDASTSAWRQGDEKTIESVGKKLAGAYRLRHFNLAAAAPVNAAVERVEPANNLVRTQFANDFRATARAYGATVESSILWKLGDDTLPSGPPVSLDAQTPPVTQSNAQVRTGGPTVIRAELSADDRLKVDNVRYRTIDVAAEMKVLIVEGRRGATELDGSGAFVDLALAPPALDGVPGRQTDSYIKPERISDIELGGRPLGDYRAIVMTDVAQVAPSVADQLQKFVKQGGTLIWFMGEQVQRENYNSNLVSRGLLPGALVQRKSGPGFTFAFNPTGNNHPLLRAFENVEKSGLDTAQVFTYWQVTPKAGTDVQRVLNFQGGEHDPAITLQPLGDGRVVFFASSADAEWTNFPAKPAYVALMHEILAGTVAGSERWMNLEVGQRVVLSSSLQFSGTPSLQMPDGKSSQPLEQATQPDGALVYQSQPLKLPGIYTLLGGALPVPISVNVPADSADLRPLTDEALRQTLGNVTMETYGADLPAEAAASAESRDFGWSLLLIVFGLLGAECFVAMRFGHHRR
ncbi:MAG: BatA domain-containing protein [Tepidisphaeraceae bacterium]